MFIRTQIAFEVAAGGSIVSKIENSIYPLMREESIGAKDLVTFIFRYEERREKKRHAAYCVCCMLCAFCV